jgi:hypothetical protein
VFSSGGPTGEMLEQLIKEQNVFIVIKTKSGQRGKFVAVENISKITDTDLGFREIIFKTVKASKTYKALKLVQTSYLVLQQFK